MQSYVKVFFFFMKNNTWHALQTKNTIGFQYRFRGLLTVFAPTRCKTKQWGSQCHDQKLLFEKSPHRWCRKRGSRRWTFGNRSAPGRETVLVRPCPIWPGSPDARSGWVFSSQTTPAKVAHKSVEPRDVQRKYIFLLPAACWRVCRWTCPRCTGAPATFCPRNPRPTGPLWNSARSSCRQRRTARPSNRRPSFAAALPVTSVRADTSDYNNGRFYLSYLRRVVVRFTWRPGRLLSYVTFREPTRPTHALRAYGFWTS